MFTICDGLRDDLIKRGIPGGKIGVMRNGVDLSLFGDPPPRDDALASELGIADHAPVIGYIGSFYDYEGVDDLIAAMPLLRRQHPDAQLLLVGAGEMESSWRASAAALPDPGAVIFTGRVPHHEVERYYSVIDVLAYPRKSSRLTDLVTPLKPLEAMAQRRIVAASDVGGHRELITDGETGVLFRQMILPPALLRWATCCMPAMTGKAFAIAQSLTSTNAMTGRATCFVICLFTII